MPTFLFFVLMNFAPLSLGAVNPSLQDNVLILLFVTTFIIPFISVVIFKYTSMIENLEMHDRSERVLPFFFITIIYGLTAYLFYEKLQFDINFVIVLSGMAVIIFISTLLTLFWKISIHSTAVNAVIGMLIGFIFKYPDSHLLYPIVIGVLVAGFVMSSRLYLNEHTFEEVMGGAVLGFIISFSTIYVFVK